MNGIIDFALDHTRTVMTALVMILLAGVVSYSTIPKEAEPDVNIPYIFISVPFPGVSPEDAERLLVRPLERELKTVEGTKEMRAIANEGLAQITMEFQAGFDADRAMQDVRDAVDIAKAELPQDAEEPIINEINVSEFPVLVVALYGDVPERVLQDLAKRLRDEIETIPQVLDAEIGGYREPQVDIVIDPAILRSYNLSFNEFANFVARNNQVVTAGRLENSSGSFPVSVPGLIETVPDVLTLPVLVGDDAVVTVDDVATGRNGYKDRTGHARINGQPAVTLEVSKRVGENLIETVEAVKSLIHDLHPMFPPGVNVQYTSDKSDHIRTMLSELQNSVITAILLVMVVVVAALGLRAGLFVGIAIPGAFLLGILILDTMGLTMNMVILFALILSVGMLVDGAIVIVEYGDRKMVEGKDRREAYRLAAKRMAWPVTASTATTLAAFTPLLFWTGLMGEFMRYLPLTLITVLGASLLMALIFVPTLGALFGKPIEQNGETATAVSAESEADLTKLGGITGWYTRVLDTSLRHSTKVLVGAAVLLVAAQVLYWTFGKGVILFPESEPEVAAVYVHARGNLSAQDKFELTKTVETRLKDLDGVQAVYTRSGEGVGYDGGAPDIVGSLQFEFVDWQDRRPIKEILKDASALVSDLPGVRIEAREEDVGPPTGRPFHLDLMSDFPETLPKHVDIVRQAMDAVGGFENVEDTRPLPAIKWELTLDRAQAAKFDVDIQSVGAMVQLVTKGLIMTDYRPDGEDDEVDITARFPEDYRSLEQLETVQVNTTSGPVPVSSFVTMTAQQDDGEIRRIDSRRTISVKADVADGLLAGEQAAKVLSWINENVDDWDSRVAYKLRGENEEQAESTAFLSQAFLYALALMAIILITQFNSFYSTALILTAVIMSTIGVFLGLLIFQQPFSVVMSGVAVIALAGVVVNNNIVLIDTYDRLKHTVDDPIEAILRTGAQRLRPVALTSITTVCGLMPMMFKVNIDFIYREMSYGAPSLQMWQQFSIATVCGLTFSTLLTLIFTPCALKARLDIKAWLARKKEAVANLLPHETGDRPAE